jgi:heat shock protein HslJ
MKAKNLGLFLVFSALGLVACASRPQPRPADTAPGATAESAPKIKVIKELAGTSWMLVELDGETVQTPPSGWSLQSLSFGKEGLRATGNAGVNRFGGRYQQYDGELSFGPLALTRRIGPEGIMAAEQRYTQVLSRVVAWRQDGERLILLTPGEKRAAVFDPAKPEVVK